MWCWCHPSVRSFCLKHATECCFLASLLLLYVPHLMWSCVHRIATVLTYFTTYTEAEQDMAKYLSVSPSLLCLALPLGEGLQLGIYSNSNVALQAPRRTHLPACVSMETQFVHAPLQLVSLTSISAEGRLAWAHTYTESQPQRVGENWQRRSESVGYVWEDFRATERLWGVMAFI